MLDNVILVIIRKNWLYFARKTS